MALKFFQDKSTNTSIAVNPDQVIFVADSPAGTIVQLTSQRVLNVVESYLDTVARLNEV
jgi:hypothetical protein